jgi:hypothetical protein
VTGLTTGRCGPVAGAARGACRTLACWAAIALCFCSSSNDALLTSWFFLLPRTTPTVPIIQGLTDQRPAPNRPKGTAAAGDLPARLHRPGHGDPGNEHRDHGAADHDGPRVSGTQRAHRSMTTDAQRCTLTNDISLVSQHIEIWPQVRELFAVKASFTASEPVADVATALYRHCCEGGLHRPLRP